MDTSSVDRTAVTGQLREQRVLDDRQVWLTCVHDGYGPVADCFPELPGFQPTGAAVALRALFLDAGLDVARAGSEEWNPLSEIVPAGSWVVVKPNWVTDRNHGSGGWECLVTHPSLVAALCWYLVKARPRRITIGDAPVQGCNFERLLEVTGTRAAVAAVPAGTTRIELADFRLVMGDHRASRASSTRTSSDYVGFDLGRDSLLEPITGDGTPFRVTMYDPRTLRRTHDRGCHRYLVAREVIESDVVFSLPKLKTHKKAGVTGALKNLVGINGHKSYLPHHRKGGAARGGDAYSGQSTWKELAEHAYDVANTLDGGRIKAALFRSAAVMDRVGTTLGDAAGVEGSWHGNDTVWRMSLDLQRLLRYGREDGTMSDTPQRTIVTITDAVIAGQGDGPLAPRPCPLGVITLGSSPAAVEWVHAELMALDPRRIPIIAHAFDAFRYPLASFAPGDVAVRHGHRPYTAEAAGRRYGVAFEAPDGWRGHCERAVEA